MSQLNDFQVRPMRREELAFAIDLAAREGWNPGLNDAECFFAADPGGFLMGELAGEPIGCISAVSYAGRYGFIGLYIVRPEFRGQGYGVRMWQAAMARLGGHNVGLDGVPANRATTPSPDSASRTGTSAIRAGPRRAAVHASVRPAAEVAFEAICVFDRQVFPERRDAFLRAWLTQPMAGAYVASDGDRLTGYTVVRRCREGWKIGPLAADNSDHRPRLYDAAASPRLHRASRSSSMFRSATRGEGASGRLGPTTPMFENRPDVHGTGPGDRPFKAVRRNDV
jgi:GNAT superfamily N-acetyltransferase